MKSILLISAVPLGFILVLTNCVNNPKNDNESFVLELLYSRATDVFEEFNLRSNESFGGSSVDFYTPRLKGLLDLLQYDRLEVLINDDILKYVERIENMEFKDYQLKHDRDLFQLIKEQLSALEVKDKASYSLKAQALSHLISYYQGWNKYVNDATPLMDEFIPCLIPYGENENDDSVSVYYVMAAKRDSNMTFKINGEIVNSNLPDMPIKIKRKENGIYNYKVIIKNKNQLSDIFVGKIELD